MFNVRGIDMKLKITVKGGNTYTIDECGCFLQYNEHKWSCPHNTWVCNGVAERIAFNHSRVYSLSYLFELIRGSETLRYKNGSCRYYLRDIDHGTQRQHGNGIISAYVIQD